MIPHSPQHPLVLVTGATGFIGRHLCKHLLAKGYIVRGTYRNNLPGSLPTQIEWVKIGDIGPDTDWTDALSSVDYVVHLAALAHQPGQEGKRRARDFVRVNSEGTRRLVEMVATCRDVRRFVFLSSIGAMRSFSASRITITDPCVPDTDYGRSKLVAEQHIQNILQTNHTDWCIIRSTLVYGPGNPGNMSRLLKLIQARVPLPFGSIKNLRSFIFVGNLVDLIERCLVHPQASRRVFLASDGEDVSTPDLIRRIAQISGQSATILPFPTSILKLLGYIGDLLERFTGRSIGIDSYSIERLTRSLVIDPSSLGVINWHPPYSMDAGLRLTLEGSI